MPSVQFYGLLRMALDRESVEIPWAEGDNIARLLEKVEKAVSIPLSHKLLDGAGGPQPGTIVLVNGTNIHHLNGLETPVFERDVVALFPPAAGG